MHSDARKKVYSKGIKVMRLHCLFLSAAAWLITLCPTAVETKGSRDFVRGSSPQNKSYNSSSSTAGAHSSTFYSDTRVSRIKAKSGDIFSTFESEDNSVDASRRARTYSNGKSNDLAKEMIRSFGDGISSTLLSKVGLIIDDKENRFSTDKEGNEMPVLSTTIVEPERSLSGGIPFPFQIKMFWEKGMRWQNQKKRKQYCVECAKNCEGDQCDSGTCRDGRNIMITKCDAGETDQWWVYDGARVRPKRDLSLCWTRKSKYVVLDQCRSSMNKVQAFTKFDEDDKFQIRPKHHIGRSPKEADCLTNQHHPKSDEPLYMDDCKTAEQNDSGKYDDTSHWVIGIGFEGHSGGSNWSPDEGGYYPATSDSSDQGRRPERQRYRNN